MNRKQFKLPFRLKSLTPWRCPTCTSGVLALEKGTFTKNESSESRKALHSDGWDPEWTRYVYSCVLKCAHSSCQEVVVTGGTGFVDWEEGCDEEGRPEMVYYDLFYPKYFIPHLKIIDIPEQTPNDVAKELNQSFDLFFSNPASAASHVRIALENTLTDLKVKRFETTRNRRNILSLHNRVQLLPGKYEHLKELCLAIKWLGNAGSHGDIEVTKDDVMDAYDIMEVVLTELYDPQDHSIKKLAKEVNKKKGPARNKGKRKSKV